MRGERVLDVESWGTVIETENAAVFLSKPRKKSRKVNQIHNSGLQANKPAKEATRASCVLLGALNIADFVEKRTECLIHHTRSSDCNEDLRPRI